MKMAFSGLFKHFDKASIITSLIVSVSIALIMGAIDPFEILLVNSQDLAVSYPDALQCLLPSTLSLFFTVLISLFVALMIHRRVFEMVRSILLGITVSSYCQELFLNGKMVVGDNGTTLGEISDMEVSLNLLIHFAVIAAFAIVTVSRYMPSRRPAPEKEDTPDQKAGESFFLKNIAVYLFLCITVMKAVGVFSTYCANVKGDKDRALDAPDPHFFSYVPTTSFSKDQDNIYVFIVDMLDTFWCDAFLEVYPEVKDEMPGFTFYQNNMSQYVNTFPSVCCMLTDQLYDGSEREDFFERIWKEENTLSILKENGYQINLILDKSYSFGDDALIGPFCDNYVIPDDLTQELDRKALRRILYHLSLSRSLPYALKQMIPNELSAISNVEYIKVSCKEQDKSTTSAVNNNSDLHLYEYLQSAKFHADCETGVFTIIHLNGAHGENELLVEKTDFNAGSMLQRTIRANFETILYYIRSAQELGVYDNTTFIILGDHGQRTREVRDGENHLIDSVMPALLIKPANAVHAPFRYDRYTGLSNDMFMASVLEYAGIDHQKYGYSYQDIEKSQQVIERDLYWEWGEDVPKTGLHYTVTGDARDFSIWKKEK